MLGIEKTGRRNEVLRTHGADPFSVRIDSSGRFVAAACASHFGMRGRGALCVWEAGRCAVLRRRTELADGLHDVSWGPGSALACASADGCILFVGESERRVKTHTAEASSVDWGLAGVVSASYDGSVCVSAPDGGAPSVRWDAHAGQAYDARWAPRDAGVALSCGADASLALWDVRAGARPLCRLAAAHGADALAVDWCRAQPVRFASASADQTMRLWDARRLTDAGGRPAPVAVLRGHRRAVRRVRWAPGGRLLYTVGYDMALRVWDADARCPACPADESFSEFATGVDVHESLVAVCAWDQTVRLLSPLRDTSRVHSHSD